MDRQQHSGTVKFYDGGRGFGFVKSDTDAHEYFVHVSEVERAGLENVFRNGTKIKFLLLPGNEKGPKCGSLSLA